MQAALSAPNPAPIPEIPGLYLSDITIPSSPEHLQHYHITHVLSIISAGCAPRIPPALNVSHKIVGLDDNPYANLLVELELACAFIHTALHTLGARVLVHCTQGISRSASVVVAYVMRTLELDYPGALAIVKRARPIIMPNQGFEEQLVLWRQMGCSVQDANGTDKLAYVRWKNSVEGVSSEDKVVGMKLGVGRLAAAIGRRRMHETDTRSGNAPTEEKRNGDGELVKQAQEEIGKGVTRVKEVLEKRRLGKERLRADGVEKE